MKRFLLPRLICPACLPKEFPLEVSVDLETEGDIITGKLTCAKCRRRFPIREGVAQLLPEPDAGPSGGQWRYEEVEMVDRYLWSHYADLAGVAEAANIHAAWGGCLSEGGPGLDAGCSVGRTTFEMAARGGWAVGCDLSLNFIKAARRLARERRLAFSLPLEGNLREEFSLELPEALPSDNVEFLVADALRLPFARETFRQTASLNLLDRVSYPLAHLFEVNRVAEVKEAAFLFASPFSWSTSSTPEERWLGGTTSGPYQGRGIDNVRSLLEGRGKVIAPPWRITRAGAVQWGMRSHCNHLELINSQFLVAAR